MGAQTDWLEFRLEGTSPSGKTKIWVVYNRFYEDGDNPLRLGVVKWESHWRRYAFFPDDQTEYEAKCLEEIAVFLRNQTDNRVIERATERLHARKVT